MRISDWSSDVCSSDLKLLQFFRLGPLERDAARHGVAHRPGYGQAGGRSGRRIARAAESVGFASDQPPLGQIGQFQIVKKEVQKLLTRQNEPEFILSFARTRLATGALPGATGRTGNLVALYIFSIPGKDMVTIAASAGPP